MSWTDPRTWNVGEIVTKAIMDAHIKMNLRYLHGDDGTVTLADGLNLGANELTINSLETVGIDGIVNKEQVEDHTHVDTANCGTLDHGLALTGLTDDDHTQYQLSSILTTRGDTIRRSATVWERLALGTSGQYLSSNGTDVVWAAGTHVANTIVIWAGTIANIPAGFVICDGNNSTPNLLAKFVEGVATAATNPGTTGGAVSKTTAGHGHTQNAHQHLLNVEENGTIGLIGGSSGYRGNVNWLTGLSQDSRSTKSDSLAAVNQSNTDSIADIRPPFYDVAFIMKT